MPEGWQKRSLASLAGANDFIDGDWIESKDQDAGGAIRLLQVGNVLPGKLKLGGVHRWITEETALRLRCTNLQMGDILIARLPDPLGRAAIVGQLPYAAITSVDCAILRPDPSVVAREYLVQFLNSSNYHRLVDAQSTGTTRTRISRTNLGTIPVDLPPLGEQRKIAAILSSVDEAIEKTQAVIDQVQVVKKGLMQELLTKGLPGRHKKFKQTEIGEIPESWDVAAMNEILVRRPANGISPPSRTVPPGIPTFSIGALRDGRVDVMGHLKYADIDAAKAERYLLQENDLLIVRGNANPNLVGRCGLASAVPDGCIYPDLLMRVRPGDVMLPGFLLEIWNSDGVRAQLLEKAKTTNGTFKINGADVCSVVLPIPPLDEQLEIISGANAIAERLHFEERNLSTQTTLKSALMQTLLTGELRVEPLP